MLYSSLRETLISLLVFLIITSIHGSELPVSTAATCGIANFLHCRQPATCPASKRNTIYLLYDINPSEGFNLRRDVYIRLAVFVRKLQRWKEYKNVRLVLPPFRHLYHWKSKEIGQEDLPWSQFFDVESLRKYAPVLDFPEFLKEYEVTFGWSVAEDTVQINRVFQLMYFEDMFQDNNFRDKFEIEDCDREQHLSYAFHRTLAIDEFKCLKFQGSASLLEKVLRQTLTEIPKNDMKVVAFLNAEIVLHDHWGDREFWRARRSMRFAPRLVAIADDFRLRHFNSSNAYDKVQRPGNWQLERPYRGSRGGSYLCVHLRRRDFYRGRQENMPTLESSAAQIRNKMEELNLQQLFLATDATQFEQQDLKSYLHPVEMTRFTPESMQQKIDIKDGGIAIVDQIVCSHARYFIGTYESTFTYRIYEEREILGFPKSSTFNTLCKNEDQVNCSKNSVWPIVY